MAECTMDIYSKKGSKVTALFDLDGELMNGYDSEKEAASQYLKPEVVYTIERTEVGSWHTTVFLVEFPNIQFNSVHFKNVLEILPCPFCGNEAEIEQTGPKKMRIRCKACLIGIEQKVLRYTLEWLKGKLIESWNKRIK